jgi:RNA polymerase sigma-70 factor (ECF subfamily)
MSEAKPQPERKSRSGPSSGSFTVARVQVQELAALAGPEVFSSPGTDLLSDELLVDRVCRGDAEHYEVLMRRTAARLYRIARAMVGSPLRAEEVVRSAFVLAYENMSSYDRRLRFGDWISRIATHGALASLKRGSAPPLPTRSHRQQDMVRQLEDAVDALPEAFRVAFALCVLDAMPPTEVAETLGKREDAVRLAAFRGRLRVRRSLGMRFDDAESRAFGLHLSSLDEIVQSVLGRVGVRSSS